MAIALCVLTLLATALHAWLSSSGNLTAVTAQSWGSGLVACIGILVWGAIVNADFVKTTAFAYATALLAACDSPSLVAEKPKDRKAAASSKG